MHADIVYIVCYQFHNIHFHAFLYKFSVSFVMIPDIAAQMSPDDLWPHASHIIKALGLWLLMYCWNVHSLIVLKVWYMSMHCAAAAEQKSHDRSDECFSFFTGSLKLNVELWKKEERF